MKLKLPGAVYFVSNIYSLFTGLAFTVIVTRSLTVSDFGFWTMISQYLAYTAIPLSSIASFWIVRYVARGFKQAIKSGLLFGLIFSSIGLSLYLLVAFLANTYFSQPITILVLAAPQAVTYVILGALNSAITGFSPIHIGISSAVFETSKVILAYHFVRVLNLGLVGAIISVMMAQVIQLIYLLFILHGSIKQGMVDRSLIKKWFRLSWLPVYELFSGVIGGLDVLIARTIFSADALIGIKNVAGIAGSFPRYASSLSLSLYPRSLRTLKNEEWQRDLEESLRFMSLIAIPISFGNIALMDLILTIFGKDYGGAYLAGIMMSIVFLIGLLNSVIEPVIRGGETTDLKDEASLKEYLKSRLFKLITVNHLSAIVYTICVAMFLMLSTGDIYEAALYWSLASFTSIPFIAYKIKMLSNMNVRLMLPLRNILNYAASSLLMSLLIYVLRLTFFDNLAKNVVGLLTEITMLTVIGSCLYFLVVSLIDGYARKILAQSMALFRSMI
ncbi:MAG: hypothetical protein QXN54_08405 [Nitrososphaerota archaeon]